MTSTPAVVDLSGRPIRLDQQLASGGEGTVFTLPNDSTLVAKVYHRPPTAQTSEKLETMIRLANPQLLALAAWPMGLLYQARTRVLAGFVMPRLSNCQPIQQLYNPVQRMRFFPKAGWDFQIRTAANLAAAFDEVHKTGCLVGDVNQSNVQVSTQALVRLIDCDSFQVRVNGKAFLCEVGVAHYIPPELQGKSLRGLVRTENHDRFGLAVLVYQLLFVGRHPYAGVYGGSGDPSFEQLIAEFRFSQGPAAHTWRMAPPPATPTFSDIPPDIGGLFRRAFERGSEADTRPRAAEWFAALKRLEMATAECSVDAGHKYWRGTKSCVWCRLASHGGPEYYFGVSGEAGRFTVDEVKLQDVLRRLAAAQEVSFPYDRRRFSIATPAEPNPIPQRLGELWRVASERSRRVAAEKAEQSHQALREKEAVRLELQRFRDGLLNELAEEQQALDTQLGSALDDIADERNRRRQLRRILLGAAFLGLAMALLCYERAYKVLWASITLFAGLWYVIYRYLSLRSPGEKRVTSIRRSKRQVQSDMDCRMRKAVEKANRAIRVATEARRAKLVELEEAMHAAAKVYETESAAEVAARRQTLIRSEQSLAALEGNWRNLVETARQEFDKDAPTIKGLVSDCRALGSKYQVEMRELNSRSEVAARIRHMRLHLISDAEIPKIGSGRKQVLAANGVFTAADIDAHRISRISGFGDVLKGNLLAWKEQVNRQFRFNPTTAVAPADIQVITVKFRNKYQLILSELEGRVAKVESLAPTCRAALEKLVPELQRAVATYGLAEASLRILDRKAQ